MIKMAWLICASFVLSGCPAVIPFENLTSKNYSCKEQLAQAVKEMAVNDLALVTEVKLMATNDVSCVDALDEESMANVAVVAFGSRENFLEPKTYYVVAHIHFSGKHGKLFGHTEENWTEMKNENEWLREWCVNFIRWSYPDEWKKQGCSVYGGLKNGHSF